jgi:hypothetical protein
LDLLSGHYQVYLRFHFSIRQFEIFGCRDGSKDPSESRRGQASGSALMGSGDEVFKYE